MHRYLCSLRWGDMDAFGHVNNVVFAQYLEQARVDLMFDAATGERLFADGVVVAELSLRYRTPLVYRPAPVPIDLWVSEIGNASFAFEYRIADDDGPVYVTARSVQVPYDLAEGRPRRLNADERAVLERLVAP